MATTEEPGRSSRRWPVRLAWLLALWAGGVATMGLAAWLLRLIMRSVGLS